MARELKYQPLADHLRRVGRLEVEMSFEEMASLVDGLPESASRYPQWWENSGHHSQAKAWLEAGYRVELADREQKRVRFAKRQS